MPAPYRLRLYENYRFVLYAPFYAAHAIGAYADEGLEVELLPSPGAGRAEAALAAGGMGGLCGGQSGRAVDGPNPGHEPSRRQPEFAPPRLCRGGLPRSVLAGRQPPEPRL